MLDEQMKTTSTKLEEEKKLNIELVKLMKNLINTKNGSEVLIDNSKEEYNTQYYYNVELIIGVLITSGLLYYLFKPVNTSTAT